ncbi:MAG: glutaredoxin domain-containing protein [Patescibacteria group bacterium]|nr:glutaredoxin domain-containing protein [Patescibacteria group bacterium]
MSVLVYSTTSCPYCNMAKDYFKANNVEYTDYNVGEDQAKGQEMVQKSGQMGVPVIDIDGTIIIGFNKEKINAVLGL